MNIVAGFFRSSLGKKYIMALTGFALFGFVVAHMLGNLQIFMGPNQINAYGHFLQSTPELIWPARIFLLTAVALHVWSAINLSSENRAARPVAYTNQKVVAASYASRTMLMSGLITAAFIIYHLLHYTVQVRAISLQNEDFLSLHDAAGRHDVYRMMILGFSQPLVSIFYLIGVGLLCLHLSHGVSSMFQSIGWKNKRYGAFLDPFARFVAVALFAGYASIPLAVLTHLLK
jgi:succinate dehydrogenase / fumarate reductase, cytochrome b subunit